MEQQTGSKSGKEYIKIVYCHPVYLTYMQSTSCEMPGWMKHKLDSRFLGEKSITLDTKMRLWHKVRKNWKASWWSWKNRVKKWLKTQHSKNKDHGIWSHQFSSVQSLSHVRLFATPWSTACQASLSITDCRVHPNLCPLCWWRHQTISSSVVPFSSCPQSFPASGSFPMHQHCTSGGQIIGVSALTSVLPLNTQYWSPLGWTGWISFQSKGLSRVFSNTTVQKHQLFNAQLSL